MLSKRSIIIFFIIISLISINITEATAVVVSVDKLDQVELILYGKNTNSSILDKVIRIEKTLFGTVQQGSLITRSKNLYNYIYSNNQSTGLYYKVNAMEWSLTTTIKQGNLVKRINRLEELIMGNKKNGPLQERINYLIDIIFIDNKVFQKKIKLPKGHPIKIKILDNIDTSTSKPGDKINYMVVNNLVVNSTLIMPAGVIGTVEVLKVDKSGKIGKEGRLKLKLSNLTTIDGSEININVIKESEQQINSSQQLALGASILGAAVLGPVGLIMGYFVEGKEESISKNTTIFVQTTKETEVYGYFIDQ